MLASTIALAMVPAAAGATFGGPTYTNGDIAFDSTICGLYMVFYVNPAAVPAGTGCTPWINNEQTTVGDDSSPFYSQDTKTVYFQSNRTNPSGSASVIYSIPAVYSGSAIDGATQVTSPGTSADYGPTVTADGSRLGFIRCTTSTSCGLWTKALPSGSETQETTNFTLVNVSSNNTTSDRPEFNPANSSQILYECSVTVAGTPVGHICLHTVGATTGDVDLSNQAEASSPWAHTDENPDFKYDGSAIIFDTTGGLTNGLTGSPASNVIFVMNFNSGTNSASGAGPVWKASAGQGNEIQPIFSPDGKSYAWTHVQSGSYIEDLGAGFSAPTQVSPARSHSSQPTWEGTAQQAIVPEAPYAALLPAGGLGLGAFLIIVRRRRRAAIATA
jgi:hypothetical protein